MARPWGNPGRESDRLDIEMLIDGKAFTAPKPRRSVGRFWRVYRAEIFGSLAFAAFLVVVLFTATGKIGN